jgi:hypothetical protein
MFMLPKRSCLQPAAALVAIGCVALNMTVSGASQERETCVDGQSLDFFDATRVHPQARGFQLANYDRGSRRVIFYPWGGIVTRPHGTVLAYHTDRDFSSPESYETVDLTALLSPDAQGFGTGFLDDASTWAYFVPFRTDRGRGQEANDLAIRFDLTKRLSDRGAYQTFRLGSLPLRPPHLGWITGVHASGFAYFVPYGTPIPREPWHVPHGILLRYDTGKSFTDASAWQWQDLTQLHPRATGFQSVAFMSPWLYLVPYYPGNNLLVRYDVTKPFNDPASYETVELTRLNRNAIGYTGAIVAGDYLVLVPWRKRVDTVNLRRQSASVAAAFDTRKPLAEPASWSFLDLTRLHPEAKGYQFGWFDKNRFVHFVPTHNFATRRPPPFVVWDSAKPFHHPGSWTVHRSTGVAASTGAAYDGEHAWLAPFGSGVGTGKNGRITRIGDKRCTAPADGRAGATAVPRSPR